MPQTRETRKNSFHMKHIQSGEAVMLLNKQTQPSAFAARELVARDCG